jgi:hydrophobic/amphiphilic exporter-1 (mainly G- bacteria), HAE1 family
MAMGLFVEQLSNANSLEVDRKAKAALEQLSKNFPPGLEYAIAFDSTTAVGESIREVLVTLAEAVVIVIAVIFLFLLDWRATIIPAVTIPVSLIGTFAFIRIFDFSINSLTLFGITLATGLVVDDAIVVIENVQRHIHMEHSKCPRGHFARHEGGDQRGDRDFAGADCRVRAGLVLSPALRAFFTGSFR